ncbi:hypothetical protein SNOG_10739 [Parastagonospora nodorum SN15]|uniref:Uncharacterized protein n=1 Tax=Phaeosphaeria nodorum (strain SN15 / ATCC MYA-4574 / FGSC 10173) TaxID=321614 RepID=Q0UBX5_PHANO|nr:hypothetical protein SNOG_10739 [Parastagonospora nodorum SN15]EAT82133.2 hypothetical protein SNOG_10739 [Parastagonospora nodorum SN15]
MHQVTNAKTPPNDTKDASSDSSERPRSDPVDAFRIPNFARSPAPDSWLNSPQTGSSPNPQIRRVAASSSPMPSPKTVLYISLIFAVLSQSTLAKPISPFAPAPYHARTVTHHTITTSSTATQTAGKVFSWMSTFLYLGSRLPQLYMNQIRKSTARSLPHALRRRLLRKPLLLFLPPHKSPGEGAGWVDPEGSNRENWVLRATPFFLGAAGVLIMDAAVGLQFWYFGDNEPESRGRAQDDDVIITVDDHGKLKRRHLHWRRVSGWMRGWAPAVSVAATPTVSRATTPADTPREGSPQSVGGSSSKSIPIRGPEGRCVG